MGLRRRGGWLDVVEFDVAASAGARALGGEALAVRVDREHARRDAVGHVGRADFQSRGQSEGLSSSLFNRI